MTTDPFGKLIDHLETEVNWKKIFGVVESVYSDDGFTTNADNFTRATTIEKAVEKFSDLERVDQPGWDFVYHSTEKLKVEMKMRKNLFYKRNPHKTQTIKMKNFQGDKKGVEEFAREKTFDYAMILCLTTRRVILVEDEVARSRYYGLGDGVNAQFDLGDYYQCDIGELNDLTPIMPKQTLSEQLKQTIDNYLDF